MGTKLAVILNGPFMVTLNGFVVLVEVPLNPEN